MPVFRKPIKEPTMSLPYNSLEPQWEPLESIPFGEAVLCANCGMITRAKNGHCPVCESLAIVNIARLLDRGLLVNPMNPHAHHEETF